MAEKTKVKSKSKGDDKVVKKSKSKEEKKSTKSSKKSDKQASANGSALTLLASDKTLNADLSSLFAVKQPAVKADVDAGRQRPAAKVAADELDNEADLESLSEDYEDDSDDSTDAQDKSALIAEDGVAKENTALDRDDEETQSRRKRKRKGDEDLEEKYMSRVAREEAKDAERAAIERASKRQKASDADAAEPAQEDEDDAMVDEDADDDEDMEDDEISEGALEAPPKHETQVAADEELLKASRTVFLGNVSTSAITSKTARKALMAHLESFFPKLPAVKDGAPKHKVDSIRFRSTAYASAIPKKAAFAKQELMDATTKSTNAYAVYSTQILAREAAKRLNGTVVLDRHLRVDEVAHPAKVDNRRCVFVGNLGFVDDETNIQNANEEEGREVRKRGKEPADVEEGLWRTFGKCGAVESVRVIRDSTTRVGKGIAYVQFADENGVEAALLLNEKKFPPMLPRKLRVSRAKAQKRNPKPGSDRPTSKPRTGGYQRKVTSEEASKMGRAGKLLGRAAASKMRKPEKSSGAEPRPARPTLGDGIKRPENFVFEGYRASSKGGKTGLKLGRKTSVNKSSAKKVKVTKRSANFRADKRKKSA